MSYASTISMAGKGSKWRAHSPAKYATNFSRIKWRNSPSWKKPIKEKSK